MAFPQSKHGCVGYIRYWDHMHGNNATALLLNVQHYNLLVGYAKYQECSGATVWTNRVSPLGIPVLWAHRL